MSRHLALSSHGMLSQGPWHRLSGLAVSLLAAVKERNDRADQRRALATLDDRMLRDIGLSRADVDREYLKSSWEP